MDAGNRGYVRYRIDDRSPAALDRIHALFSRLQVQLAARNPGALSSADLINYETGAFLASTTLKSFEFPFGKEFHDRGQSIGSVPLDVFTRAMEGWGGRR